MTSIKDIETLELLIEKIKNSKHDTYICTLCGQTTNGWVSECSKCHYKSPGNHTNYNSVDFPVRRK